MTKFVIIQFSPASPYVLCLPSSLTSKYSPPHLFSFTLNLCSSLDALIPRLELDSKSPRPHAPYLLTYLLTPWCRTLFEKLIITQPVKKYPAFFMEPQGPSPCSQKPAIGSYPEPAESNSPNRFLLPKVQLARSLLHFSNAEILLVNHQAYANIPHF
jgi:hypothetical protein